MGRVLRQAGVMLAVCSCTVWAGSSEVPYEERPAWVIPVPQASTAPSLPGATVRIDYLDLQVCAGQRGDAMHSVRRARILKPEALRFGNVTLLEWEGGHDGGHGLKNTGAGF